MIFGKENLPLEQLFEKYLELVKLDKGQMSEVQLRETKQAYIAGISSILGIFMSSENRPEEEVTKYMQDLYTDCVNYWEPKRIITNF